MSEKNTPVEEKKKINKKKVVGWTAVLTVLIPLLVTILSSLDGDQIGKHLNAKLTGQQVVSVIEEVVAPDNSIPDVREEIDQVVEKLQLLETKIEQDNINREELSKVVDELRSRVDILVEKTLSILSAHLDPIKASLAEARERLARIEGKIEGQLQGKD